MEKDVTGYSDTLRRAQPVEMLIGNVVNETYTGVIDVKVTLTFYTPGRGARAAETPDVWTGGWSNPFLWYVVPGPRALDVMPVQYDLTPFAGLLNDGRPHRLEVSVVGVPPGQTGWSTPVNVLVWQDEGRDVLTGALTRHEESRPLNSATYTPGAEHRLDTRGAHRLTVAGHLDTSTPRTAGSPRRSPGPWRTPRSTAGATARTPTRSRPHGPTTRRSPGQGAVTATHRTYEMDGVTTLGEGDRLCTVLTLADKADTTVSRGARRLSWWRLDDTYTGDATYAAQSQEPVPGPAETLSSAGRFRRPAWTAARPAPCAARW